MYKVLALGLLLHCKTNLGNDLERLRGLAGFAGRGGGGKFSMSLGLGGTGGGNTWEGIGLGLQAEVGGKAFGWWLGGDVGRWEDGRSEAGGCEGDGGVGWLVRE